MFNSTSLLGYLNAKHPKAFKSWDGFQSTVIASNRKNVKPSILVGLYNKPTQEKSVNLSCSFLVDVDSGNIRIGGEALIDQEQKKIFPEVCYEKL